MNTPSVSMHLFWSKITLILCSYSTAQVSFNAIKIILIRNLHHVGVNVRCYSVNKTLNWCSHSCKNLHFFSVTITPSIFLCSPYSGNQPAPLPRRHSETREGSFVSLNQLDNRLQIFVEHKLSRLYSPGQFRLRPVMAGDEELINGIRENFRDN